MEQSNRLLQALGIPFSAVLSVIFGLLVISLPIGLYVVFATDIGGDINYDFPITHLEIFEGTAVYRHPADVSVGDAFAVLWAFYVIVFAVAALGPGRNFLSSVSLILSEGRIDSSNHMIGIIKWFSVLVLASVIVTYVQDWFGIATVPPPAGNGLVHFFYVSLASLVEEVGFRMLLVGVPLFLLYSRRTSLKFFAQSLWSPSRLDIVDYRKAVLIIALVGVTFGFAHVAFEESWSEGKFAQASVGGLILGWAYVRYGFVASLLIHWATNYFIFAYVHFVSQVHSLSLDETFVHPLVSSLELLLVLSGGLSVAVILACRFRPKKQG